MHDTRDGLRGRFGRFFFAEEVPFGLALLRILVPLVLLIPMLPRWFHARELFSTDGAAAPLWITFGFPNAIPELPGGVAVAFHTALIFCLVTAAIGWRTRLSTAAVLVLYTWLNLLDSVGTITKYSVIASHVLLLLTVSNCGAVWSVDAWLRRRRAVPGVPAPLPRFPAWPRRLVQLLIGIVYFGAAITKMSAPSFTNGDQMIFWMMTHLNFDQTLGEYLTLYPSFIVIGAYVSLVWEVLFVFLAWRGFGRLAMLGMGVVFHLMTALTLGLTVFPLLCISIYASFLNEEDVRRMARWIRRWKPERPSDNRLPVFPSPRLPVSPSSSLLIFSASLALTCIAGMAVEHWMDPYGKRRAEGPFTLRELDDEYVQALLSPSGPLRQQDKFFSFDVGTVSVGGRLLNRRDRFRPGEVAIAQASLNPPHEDLWLECKLHDSQGRVMHRMGQVVLRENHVADFHCELSDSLEPGEYAFVLVSRGREIAHRPFTLQPRVRGAVGN